MGGGARAAPGPEVGGGGAGGRLGWVGAPVLSARARPIFPGAHRPFDVIKSFHLIHRSLQTLEAGIAIFLRDNRWAALGH